eukprot:TRINITY_DN9092_c0_g1_i5.p1 TRINITY_DN9092_c0_g1~~TRINITY_DN9092_c0_g1_i5.p1  ORF type:complete len:529 (+),score=62.97 TRINITY_DN9092_c0_g1_i5:41-1627(+)
MECDGDSLSGETLSVISSELSFNSKGSVDHADMVLDGVRDPDMEHDLETELWNPDGDEEAEWLFNPTPPGSLQDVDEVDRLSLDSWASESEEEECGKGRRKKIKKGEKDSATTQDVTVIDHLLQAIEDQGGFSTAQFSFIDFESAANASSVACSPCEVAILTTPLHLNTTHTRRETALIQSLDHTEDPIERQKIVNILEELGTPKGEPFWYHRIMHPGHLSLNHLRTAKVNMTNVHGIPLGGIKGCARNPRDFYEILKGLEWAVSGLGGSEVGFRESKNRTVMRHPASVRTKKKTLLFGMGVNMERTALCSMAQYARDQQGGGPFRWLVPVYDLTHLIQAMYRKVRCDGPELLSPAALSGITLWAVRNCDDEIKTACHCKYHEYINERMFTVYNIPPSVENSFHCALYDVHCVAEKTRYITTKYFPTLLESACYRNPPEPSWIDIPPRKNPPPAPEHERLYTDFITLIPSSFPPSPWAHSFWAAEGKKAIFETIETYVKANRQDEAGRLTWAWFNVSATNLVSPADEG